MSLGNLPRTVAAFPILPCLTPGACKFFELLHKSMLHTCHAQNLAHRQAQPCPPTPSALHQVFSNSVPSQCLWDVLSEMKE